MIILLFNIFYSFTVIRCIVPKFIMLQLSGHNNECDTAYCIPSAGLDAPNNVVAEMVSCDTVVLVWTQPDEPEDITTSVSCTPPSPGCAECTTSPCNITGLNPSTEYIFTVTLSSSLCGTSMNKTEAFQIGEIQCAILYVYITGGRYQCPH